MGLWRASLVCNWGNLLPSLSQQMFLIAAGSWNFQVSSFANGCTLVCQYGEARNFIFHFYIFFIKRVLLIFLFMLNQVR